MLEITDISSGYGYNLVLDGLSLYADDGEIVTIIGANGAGKSTLLNTISGLVRLRKGSIRLDGEKLPSATHKVVKNGVIQVPEGRKVFANLTVQDNLIMGGYLMPRHHEHENLRTVYKLFPVLEERKKQIANTLSGGEQQMLAIGRALMGEPKVMLLDEPSLGLAPIYINLIFSFIKELNQSKGITILLVEQNAVKALGIATRAYVIEGGRIITEGDAVSIAANEMVAAAYLGKVGYSKSGTAEQP